VSLPDIKRPGKNHFLSHVRSMAAWVVQDIPILTLKQLAEKTGRDISSLSVAAQRVHKRSRTLPGLSLEKECLLAEIAKYQYAKPDP